MNKGGCRSRDGAHGKPRESGAATRRVVHLHPRRAPTRRVAAGAVMRHRSARRATRPAALARASGVQEYAERIIRGMGPPWAVLVHLRSVSTFCGKVSRPMRLGRKRPRGVQGRVGGHGPRARSNAPRASAALRGSAGALRQAVSRALMPLCRGHQRFRGEGAVIEGRSGRERVGLVAIGAATQSRAAKRQWRAPGPLAQRSRDGSAPDLR